MKSRYKIKYLGMVFGATMLVTPALASSVFMLQFGSYQSADEAQSHLDELRNKHIGALSRLTTSVRPVTLPPDNLTVYRTQAGPLATRNDAQSVCSQLASNGDECYIVETAMSAVNSAPVVSTTPAAPTPSVRVPSPSAAVASAPTTTDSLPPSSLPQTVITDGGAARDPQNVAALNSVSSSAPAVATVAAVENSQTANAESNVNQALDDAAARQQTAQASTANERPHRSFWDRINPFSDSDETSKPASVVKPSADTAVAAVPVEPVQSEPAIPVSIPPSVSAPTVAVVNTPSLAATPSTTVETSSELPHYPLPAPPASSVESGASSVSSQPVSEPAPLGTMPAAIAQNNAAPAASASPYPLPPPPAPLNGYSPTPATNTVQAAAPVESRPLAPISTGRPASNVQTPFTAAANGNVRVEEAQRVPLSQLNPPPAPRPAPIMTPPSAPAVNLSPSATLGQRTIWAQIGQFANAQKALAFWTNYRMQHPDFPVVRVRVTSPLAQEQRGMSLVSLRVGPFARPEFVNALCNSLVPADGQPEPGMRCGAIADLGVAVNPYGSAQGGYLGASRYHR